MPMRMKMTPGADAPKGSKRIYQSNYKLEKGESKE